MLNKLRICLCAALLLPGVTTASETAVKQAMQKKYPTIPVESVARTPLPGDQLKKLVDAAP